MSKASDTFSQSIQDAENLLKHFNALNSKPPPPEIEVLKRAGLVMAMTAWETYVEDRVMEVAADRLRDLEDGSIVALVQAKLEDEINRLHNPTAERTIQLFQDYAGINVSERWSWNQNDTQAVSSRLNEYIRLRGNVVHRSRAVESGAPTGHAVTKQSLERAIRFLRNLVNATEKALLVESRR